MVPTKKLASVSYLLRNFKLFSNQYSSYIAIYVHYYGIKIKHSF